jgi:exodeoxyribonuclease X
MRFFVLDTETTGVGKDDRPCQVAWIEVDEQLNELRRVESLIDPQKKIPPGASGVHGITDKDVADSPTMEEFLGEVLDDPHHPRQDPIVMIAYNAQFDRRMMDGTMNFVDPVCCVMRLAKKFIESDDYKLQTISYVCDVERGPAHAALGDVITTVNVLRWIMKATGHTLHELIEISPQPLNVATMPFGKHRGTPMAELPRSYISWALNNMTELDPDLEASLRAQLA